MAYIRDKATRDMLYNELGRGNSGAKDILSALSSMTQDELNEALAKFIPTPQDANEVIDGLIADEYEAVNGYNNAISLLKSYNTPEAEFKIKELQHILNEELEHITELKNLKDNVARVDDVEDGE